MFKKSRLWVIMLVVVILVFFTGCNKPANKEVILATTTSTLDSGLLDILKPKFEKETGYDLIIVSVGSGAAIAMAERGEADALLVHSPKDEERIEAAGLAVNRQLVMHNDFIVIGPAHDPAHIKGKTSTEALKAIAENKSLFISRGDDSGTHKKELNIWEKAGIQPQGDWYQETGTGMGQTISVASEKEGYTLSDRATYLAQQKNSGLSILSEGDRDLLNIYHVMEISKEKFDKVNAEGARAFVDFMVSEKNS